MTNNSRSTEAVIHLKNGTRKYGILVNEPIRGTEDYRIISHNYLEDYERTGNSQHVEIVPGALIEAIETDLK